MWFREFYFAINQSKGFEHRELCISWEAEEMLVCLPEKNILQGDQLLARLYQDPSELKWDQG